MSKKRGKLLSELQYIKGEVVTEPTTYSTTHVSGGGGGNNTHVSISSSTTIHSRCMIKLPTGKEYQLKWASEIPARIGHTLDIAKFRGITIAFRNETTENTHWHDERIKNALAWKDYRGIPFWPFFIAIFAIIIWGAYVSDEILVGVITACILSIVAFLPFGIFAAFRRGSFTKALRNEAVKTLKS